MYIKLKLNATKVCNPFCRRNRITKLVAGFKCQAAVPRISSVKHRESSVKQAWTQVVWRERPFFGVSDRAKIPSFFDCLHVPDFSAKFFFVWTLSAPYHLDPALCFCWLRLSSFTKDVTKRWACRSISRLVFGPTNLQAFDFKLVELFVEQGFAKLSWEMTSLC